MAFDPGQFAQQQAREANRRFREHNDFVDGRRRHQQRRHRHGGVLGKLLKAVVLLAAAGLVAGNPDQARHYAEQAWQWIDSRR
ncbi:hypothetical protein OG216_47165 (plasmid) [Streptomycetaceae bacterium NBC_01309]